MSEDQPGIGIDPRTPFTLVECLDEALAFKEWLGTRHARDAIAVDTETTGLEEHLPTSKVRLIQFGDTEQGWALPWDDWRGIALEALRQWRGDIVMHHAKFDVKWVEAHCDFRFDRSRLHDTKVQAHLLDSTLPTGLKPLTDRLIDSKGSLGQQLLKRAFEDNGWWWDTVPVNYWAYWEYGALDATMTAMLHDLRIDQIKRECPEAYDLEMAVQFVCMDMEINGARIDVDYAANKQMELDAYAASVRSWCKQRYGFAMGSNGQLAGWFTDHGCEFDETTPTGQPKVDKDQLQAFAISEDPEVAEVAKATLSMRKSQKLASAYFGNFVDDNRDGVIHPSINTLAARTSRMSISGPALQQLPKGDATVRRAFVPREEGHVLMASDLDQVEFRMFAAYSRDPGLVAMFAKADRTRSDAFTEIMRQVYRNDALSREDKRRGPVKSMIYGRLYGAGVKKQAETAGVSYDEMKALADEFDSTYPGVSDFQAQVEDIGKRREYEEGRGWIQLKDGRKLYSDKNRSYTLVNYLLQGGAAAVFKRNLLRLSAAGLSEYMIVPVHDEIVMSVPEAEVPSVKATLAECMTTTDGWDIPLTAGVDGPYRNWGEKYE